MEKFISILGLVLILVNIFGDKSNKKKTPTPIDLDKESLSRRAFLSKLAPPEELQNKVGGLSITENSPLKGSLYFSDSSKGGLSDPK